jgi:capsular polysaccharide biosynthesis protein
MSENTKQQNSNEVEIDLMEIARLLLSKIWTLIIVGVLVGGLMAGYTAFFKTPLYKSTSQIFILNNTMDLSLADLQIGSQLTQDYTEIITSRPVLEATIQELKLDMNYAQLRSALSISNPQNTRVLYITITNTDAYMAKTIVDKLTDVSIDFIANIMNSEKPNVIDYGHIPSGPFSPNMKKNVILGVLLGMILASAVIIVRYLMNDAIHTSEDIEKYLGINTIGMIPYNGTDKKKGRKKKSSYEKSASTDQAKKAS